MVIGPGLQPVIYTKYSVPGGTGGKWAARRPLSLTYPAGTFRPDHGGGRYRRCLIGGDAGRLDHPGPQRHVRLDDVGESPERRALCLAPGGIELLAHL